MTKLSELLSNPNLEQLPKLAKENFRLLWHCDYWDGPKSGVLLFQNKKCWFEVFDENEGSGYFRRFAIVELTDSQLEEEEYWHTLFRANVGAHTDYDEMENRPLGEVNAKEMWSKFYDAYKNRKPRDYSNNPVVGWFEN